MNDKNLAAAVNVFAKNAEVKQLFFTSDGQCFYKKGPALVHQKEIKGAEDAIETIDAGDMAASETANVKSETGSEAVVAEKPKSKSKKKETE